MAEFCLDCLREFEPNANGRNSVLSKDYYICDGCGKSKRIVVSLLEVCEEKNNIKNKEVNENVE